MVTMSFPRDARPVEISDDVIRLGQFLKLAGLAESGAEARELVTEGEVRVNGEVDTRRGRQLHRGDVVSVDRPQGSESATVA
ncbi:RNA-binding protein S4 [Cellulosimicrobium sp. MM]|nr:RNA-binding protein S4 [Cellulosimicrobium sp. MM]